MLRLPKCDFCKYLREDTYACEAFPDGIPNGKLWVEDEKVPCNGEYHYEMKLEYALRESEPKPNSDGFLSRLLDVL